MMRLQEIDVQELDKTLGYWEAKSEIEVKYRTRLVLKMEKLKEKMREELPRKYMYWEALASEANRWRGSPS